MKSSVGRVSVLALAACLILVALPTQSTSGGSAGPFQFHSLTPCRLVDTRLTPGPFPGNGSPIVTNNTTRNFTVQGNCGVPAGAAAVTINSTAIGPTGAGFLTLFPSGITPPTVSNLNFNAGEPALGNGAIVPLAATTPDLGLYAKSGPLAGAGTVHVVIDVTGYFAGTP
jgi:hypothetical protein